MSTKISNGFLVSKESFIQKILLPISEASKFTGISKRRIRYWTKRKNLLINRSGSSRYKYNFRDLQKLVLVKQFYARGKNLEKAFDCAEEILKSVEQEIGRKLSVIEKEDEEKSIETIPAEEFPKSSQEKAEKLLNSILSSKKFRNGIEQIVEKKLKEVIKK